LICGAKVIKKWEINRYLQIFLKKKIRSSEVGDFLLTYVKAMSKNIVLFVQSPDKPFAITAEAA